MLEEFQNNQITGNVSLQQQLAAMNQGVRAQGAQGLAGIGSGVLDWGSQLAESVAGGLGTLGSGFQQASEFNAANARRHQSVLELNESAWDESQHVQSQSIAGVKAASV